MGVNKNNIIVPTEYENNSVQSKYSEVLYTNLSDTEELSITEDSFQSDYTYDLSDIEQLDGYISLVVNNSKHDNTHAYQNNNEKSNSSYFRVIEANVNSLKGKKEEFKSTLDKYKPDCIVLVETKLDESYSNSEFFFILTNGI